jgi:MFS family permease
MSVFGFLIWSSLSDKIGRRLSLIILLTGMIITSIGFSLSPSDGYALSFRILAGLMSGVLPITKALIQDVSDDTNIAVSYSYLGAGYGFSIILARLIEKVLRNQYKNFP